MTQTIGTNCLTVDRIRKRLSNCLEWFRYRHEPEWTTEDPGEAFRSPILANAAAKVFPKSCHTSPSSHVSEAFSQFIELRTAHSHGTKEITGMLETELTRPKALLVTDWAKSLFDGAITPETDGFIDDDCMPPWDCWVDICNIEEAYGDLCLISWVPPLLAEKVDRGIFIDAAECMSWLVVDSMGIISLNGWGKQWTTSS